MSTEDLKKTVVTLHKGVDVDAFMEEMSSLGRTTEFVPDRKVEIYNERPDSLRNVDFIMTKEEADALRNDPRIRGVRFGSYKENEIIIAPVALDVSRPYPRTSTFMTGNVDQNWGFPQTNNTTNQYSSLTTINYKLPYTLTGDGVDFIIQDTGLQVDHPEFQTINGISRVNQINWYTATATPGSLPSNFYTDVEGHGTHVCSTVAGKTYGLAKNAQIYVMNILGFSNGGNIPPTTSFNMIRLWHQAKSITSTGFVRPTLVNMSWSYFGNPNFITGGIYRGTPFTGNPGISKGFVPNRTVPYIDQSTESDLEDCLDAGVILIGAAGNSSYKIDVPGGIDYNNIAYYSYTDPSYYMRGGTPNSNPNVIKVGAVALDQTGGEKKAVFSNTGPGVQIYAPGDYIVGACSTINTFPQPTYPVRAYPYNTNFKSAKVSGTSMASPLVSAVVACLLESRPWYSMSRINEFLTGYASKNRLQDPSGGYANYVSLQGGPNNYLYNPFHGTIVSQTTELTSTIYGKL